MTKRQIFPFMIQFSCYSARNIASTAQNHLYFIDIFSSMNDYYFDAFFVFFHIFGFRSIFDFFMIANLFHSISSFSSFSSYSLYIFSFRCVVVYCI